MIPRPVIQWFYGFAYLITLVETAYQFGLACVHFSQSNFSRSSDAQTAFTTLYLLGFALCGFLAVNYFFVEQYECGKGVFEGTKFGSLIDQRVELGLRIVLFFVVSLKFVHWSDDVDEAATYLIALLAVHVCWFIWISTRAHNSFSQIRMFQILRGTVIVSSAFLPAFSASFLLYRSSHEYVLQFVLGSMLLAVVLILEAILVAMLVMREWFDGTDEAPSVTN